MERFIGWHLELTRRCSLRCPACPRTFNAQHFDSLRQDLAFKDLQKFFPQSQLNRLQFLFFQGNLGDPIYHPDFHEIAEYFFPVRHLSVITNGMHSTAFWERVLTTWPAHSVVVLSIDGLEDTNSIYRVGSSWGKIQELLDLIANTKRACKIEWKYLVFEHNRHQIDQAKKLADDVGIDSFRIQQSRELNDETSLKGKIKRVDLSEVDRELPHPKLFEDQLAPFCKTMDMHYINALGEYYPCCWWPGFYQEDNKKNSSWVPKTIAELNESAALQQFETFSVQLDKFSNSPGVCQAFCRKLKDNKREGETPNSQISRKFLGTKGPLW